MTNYGHNEWSTVHSTVLAPHGRGCTVRAGTCTGRDSDNAPRVVVSFKPGHEKLIL